MKKYFLSFILFLSSFTYSCPIEVKDLTYENLWPDDIQHIDKIFKHTPIHSILEFGLGNRTKYFLDQAEEVTSIELILHDQSPDWYPTIYKLLINYKNWTPQLIQGSDVLRRANLRSYEDKVDPALYDATYLLELKSLCDKVFDNKRYDLAFVDPDFHMRGDLVNELFDRVPIIVAHHTSDSQSCHEWWKINTPSNYEKIVFSQGCGTTFWIHKDQQDLIIALQGYPSKPFKKNLRVFFPNIHPALMKSLALALKYLGHTLVVPGESFHPLFRHSRPKLSWYFPFKKDNPWNTAAVKQCPQYYTFLKDVEIIESDEILTNPPDILFVNTDLIESEIYLIKEMCNNKNLDIKIAHYAGNNKVPYTKVQNLIAVDAYTADICDRSNTNIIFWIPWIDFETLKFEGFNDGFILNNYISHYYPHFYDSYLTFQNIVDNSKYDLPFLCINSPERCPPLEVYPLIHNSAGTLHIKETEGFGYSIIESLAKGRPVFLKRSFSLGSRLMNWCIENKTAFFFDDYSEFKSKAQNYLLNQEYKHEIQQNCASIIRKIIDNEKQARILDNFLQNLK